MAHGHASLVVKNTDESNNRGEHPMNIPPNLKYTKSDEWFDPGSGALGLTDYAQSQLSDVVFLEIQVDVGDGIEVGKAVASVESVKASAEIYAPVAGKVA